MCGTTCSPMYGELWVGPAEWAMFASFAQKQRMRTPAVLVGWAYLRTRRLALHDSSTAPCLHTQGGYLEISKEEMEWLGVPWWLGEEHEEL